MCRNKSRCSWNVPADNILILSYYVVDDYLVVNTFTKDYDCSIIILLLELQIT